MSIPADPFAAKRAWWEFLSDALIRGTNELRQQLRVDEDGFRFVAGYSHAAARDYFLYGVLDEVQKTGVAVGRWVELFAPGQDFTTPDGDDQIDRVVRESVMDEQSLWERKLVEVLLLLIISRRRTRTITTGTCCCYVTWRSTSPCGRT